LLLVIKKLLDLVSCTVEARTLTQSSSHMIAKSLKIQFLNFKSNAITSMKRIKFFLKRCKKSKNFWVFVNPRTQLMLIDSTSKNL
jgi:hypothetical protein